MTTAVIPVVGIAVTTIFAACALYYLSKKASSTPAHDGLEVETAGAHHPGTMPTPEQLVAALNTLKKYELKFSGVYALPVFDDGTHSPNISTTTHDIPSVATGKIEVNAIATPNALFEQPHVMNQLVQIDYPPNPLEQAIHVLSGFAQVLDEGDVLVFDHIFI